MNLQRESRTGAAALCIFLLAVLATASADLHGLGYSPFGVQPFCLGDAQVAKDMALIASVTQRIRLYGLSCTNTVAAVLKEAERLKMGVLLGVWLNTDEKANEQEINALKKIVTQFGPKGPGLIHAVAAGNEVLSINGGQLVYLISYIDRIREIIKPYNLSLAYVDVPSVWFGQHPSMVPPPTPAPPPPTPGTAVTACPPGVSSTVCSLLSRVDIVGSNVHPYYEGLPVTCDGLNITGCYDGPMWVTGIVGEMKRQLGTNNVAVTEVGWPSSGEACCKQAPSGFPASAKFLAKPSEANSALHLAKFVKAADAAGLQYYYFELMNAAWKRTYQPCLCSGPGHDMLEGCATTCSYEYNWGLWDENRQPKPLINMSLYAREGFTIPEGLSPVLAGGGNAAAQASTQLWHASIAVLLALVMVIIRNA